MDEMFIQSFKNILNEEEKIIDSVLQKQAMLHKAVIDKQWDVLMPVITEINLLSDNFEMVDGERDRMQSEMKTYELKPFAEKLSALRCKLLKSKVENQAIGKYINIARGFVQGVMEKAIPTSNKVYNKKGIVNPQPKSVVLSVTM